MNGAPALRGTSVRTASLIRIPEFVLFALFIFDGTAVPGIPIPIPGSDAAAILLVILAVFRRPERRWVRFKWFLPAWVLVLAYLVVESIVNEVSWSRRAFRLGVMVLFTVVAASGRLDLRSGLRGLLVGMALNVVLFYTHLAPNTYDGVLTGFLGDKNVAGMFYALVPLMTLPFVASKRWQVVLFVFAALTVFLTGSRTSLAALAAAGLWILVTPRLHRFLKLPLLIFLFWGVDFLAENYARVGMFADRLGSDELRARIADAASAKAAASPPYGMGLGQATAFLQGKDWFFHDSYLGLYVEGGWVLLLFVVGLFVFLGIKPFSDGSSRQSAQLEAATLGMLICASKLGEVFLSIPAFILLGVLLYSGLSLPRTSALKARR